MFCLFARWTWLSFIEKGYDHTEYPMSDEHDGFMVYRRNQVAKTSLPGIGIKLENWNRDKSLKSDCFG